MAPKKDLYFPVKKVKGKAGKDVELVEAEIEEAPKRVRKLRGKKAITLIQPNKLTKKELQLIKQLKLKAKPEELPTKRKMEVYQGKMEKKQREELGRLESLKAIEQKRKMEQEERFGKPVQLPPEFYTLIQALAPEKLKKSKEQELPSVRMKMEQEEADKKLAKKMQDNIDKMQKEEESLAKRREQANFSEIAKILAEQRAEQLEGKKAREEAKAKEESKSREKEESEMLLIDLPKQKDESLPDYEDLFGVKLPPSELESDIKLAKDNPARYKQMKDDNFTRFISIYDDLKPKGMIKKPISFDKFKKLPIKFQEDIIVELQKSADYEDYVAKIKDMTDFYKQADIQRLKIVPSLTDEEIDKMSANDVKKFMATHDLIPKGKKGYSKKELKSVMARKKTIEGKGLVMKSKKGRGRPKKLKGGVISGAGFMDTISKAVDIGKKAIDTGKKVYEKGKDVYETGKKVYETGKQVYDVGKTAVETGKSVYKSFKGGELPKKGRGRPKKVKGGSMNFDEAMAKLTPEQRKMALDQSMKNFGFGLPLEGGIMSGAGFMDTVTKAIDTGTKIYKKGKDVYETGKKVYDTGKQVYDVGKTAVETGKSAYKSFKGGELTKKGKKQLRGGEFNLDSVFNPVALGSGLQGGIISGAGVSSRGSGYTLPLPDPKSARATYQSYF